MADNERLNKHGSWGADAKDVDLLYHQMGADVEHQYVVFALADEEYGIPILKVQEIISLPEVTILPRSPDYIRGIINLRGNIIPLIDLRVRFDVTLKELDRYSVVIIVQIPGGEGQRKTLGLIVDGVSDVLSMSPDHIMDVPAFSSAIDTAFIINIGKIDDRLIIILDIDRILTESERSSLARMSSRGFGTGVGEGSPDGDAQGRRRD